MLGLIEDIGKRCTSGFVGEGDLVFLLGGRDKDEGLAGSEYLELVHGMVAGKPSIELELEKRVQRCCLSLIEQGVIKSAHDCSDGGLVVTLAECCIRGGIGFKGDWEIQGRIDTALFGELQSRIVVSAALGKTKQLEKIAARKGVPLHRLGVVGGRRIVIKGLVDIPLDDIERAWRSGLEKALG
jgi:phosphoribosylformylglycinamidine (FGAM) synthase-like enzyme